MPLHSLPSSPGITPTSSAPPTLGMEPLRNRYMCKKCRKDHQKCLPVRRQWPARCQRCIRLNAACSEPVEAPRPHRRNSSLADSVHDAAGGRALTVEGAISPLAPADAVDGHHMMPLASHSTSITSTNDGMTDRVEFTEDEVLTGHVCLLVVLLRMVAYFRRLEFVLPHLADQTTDVVSFLNKLMAWVEDRFSDLWRTLSGERRRLYAPLQTLRIICHFIKASIGYRPPYTAGCKMPDCWEGFCQHCPRAKDILASIVNILSELGSDNIDYDLGLYRRSYTEAIRSYDHACNLINHILKSYTANCPGPPLLFGGIQLFKEGVASAHMAYWNGDKDTAFGKWSTLINWNEVDDHGIGLGYLAVESADPTFLIKMMESGHNPTWVWQRGLFGLSPLLTAASLNDKHCYLVLTDRQRNHREHREGLEIAVKAGAQNIVMLFVGKELIYPGSCTDILRSAIESCMESIACSLTSMLWDTWQYQLSTILELANLADQKGLFWASRALRNLRQREPLPEDALSDINSIDRRPHPN